MDKLRLRKGTARILTVDMRRSGMVYGIHPPALGYQKLHEKHSIPHPRKGVRYFKSLGIKENGFRFMFSTFGDLTTNEEANIEACNFIKRKIDETVRDPRRRVSSSLLSYTPVDLCAIQAIIRFSTERTSTL